MDVSFDWVISGKGPMSLKDAESLKDMLAPKKLKSTVTDLQSVYDAISYFEKKVRKKEALYKPDQVACAIMLLCLIR